VDGLWATKSEGVGLIVRAISFEDFQLMWFWSTNPCRQSVCPWRWFGHQRHRRTDWRHAISI